MQDKEVQVIKNNFKLESGNNISVENQSGKVMLSEIDIDKPYVTRLYQ